MAHYRYEGASRRDAQTLADRLVAQGYSVDLSGGKKPPGDPWPFVVVIHSVPDDSIPTDVLDELIADLDVRVEGGES